MKRDEVWVLRESFLAYERFHGVFETKEKAINHTIAISKGAWAPIQRTQPDYMEDPADPFHSEKGAVSAVFAGSLWIIEPQEVK